MVLGSVSCQGKHRWVWGLAGAGPGWPLPMGVLLPLSPAVALGGPILVWREAPLGGSSAVSLHSGLCRGRAGGGRRAGLGAACRGGGVLCKLTASSVRVSSVVGVRV